MQDFKAKTLFKISCQLLTLDVENYELPTGYKIQVILDTTKLVIHCNCHLLL